MTIKHFLKDRIFNRAEAARRLGVDRSKIAAWLAGKDELKAEHKEKLEALMSKYGFEKLKTK